MVSSLRNGELGLNREIETERRRRKEKRESSRDRGKEGGRVRRCTNMLREHYRRMTSSVPRPVSWLEPQ